MPEARGNCEAAAEAILILIEEGFIRRLRREGKVRRCYLGDRIYQFPCRASYHALGRF